MGKWQRAFLLFVVFSHGVSGQMSCTKFAFLEVLRVDITRGQHCPHVYSLTPFTSLPFDDIHDTAVRARLVIAWVTRQRKYAYAAHLLNKCAGVLRSADPRTSQQCCVLCSFVIASP